MENPKLIARTLALQDASWLEDLWLQYWANGGDGDRFDFDAYVHDLSERDPFDLDILSWAIEDILHRLT
ncbi:hypothetical protein [Pseudarthrobacter sp. B4EP4b]|uniref:hypothetical protein n=1 Tax=Pseudarthrobacter sp. B4EP4b TaxID=2590664 RepID=UPI001151C5B1|nr:hypothetical protein [Pseudarthrobacter sp. B4EP4b]